MSENPKEKKPAGYFLRAEVNKDETGRPTGISMTFTPKELLLFFLTTYIMNPKVPEGTRREIEETRDFLEEHLHDFQIKRGYEREKPDSVPISFSCPPEIEPLVLERLNRYYVTYTIARILGHEKEYFKANGISDKQRRELRRLSKKGPLTQQPRGNFPVGGHLIDQGLRRRPIKAQLSLWDTLGTTVRAEIIKEGVEVEEINQRGVGIELTQGEHKLVLILAELLHEKNGATGRRFSATLYEITQRWTGNGTTPSGAEMRNVWKVLNELANNPDKKYLIRYIREEATEKGGKKRTTVELFRPLIELLKKTVEEDDQEGNRINQKQEVHITLNEVFIDQIHSKYVPVPKGINEKMEAAYGGPKLPRSAYKLMLYLARVVSGGQKTTEINEERLLETVAPEYMRANRLKLARQRLGDAIRVCEGVGLIIGHRTETAKSSGELKYVFTLNLDWA